ncbi:hypothetical protein [Parabacteroides sp. Marseille-P3160]|uniref:hypothetical protein n=1 Tax=Parabacteroides sp. Marseille-P3160 TaxID=1917887 RepID=UPI0009BC3192|nr:hypothetical protein [Parabacteroides sp. Marseille-P3160]
MIDLITFQKMGLSTSEINRIASHNKLQLNSKDGAVCYDNAKTKNLEQSKGVFIQIETSQKLKVECSLHKYYNEIRSGLRNNYDLFTMPAAMSAIGLFLKDKKLPGDMRVYNFEIGLNLNISSNCRTFLDKIRSIGPPGDEREIYVNPHYKDERAKTTVFHRHTRKYFKVYDKVFEAEDKRRTDVPDHPILRIETAFRRVENQTIESFFSAANLSRLVETFFRDWRQLHFIRDIQTPPGTGRAKQAICLHILSSSVEDVLREARARHRAGALKDWEYRNTREFVQRDWPVLKSQIAAIQSSEEQEYRRLLQSYYQLLKI